MLFYIFKFILLFYNFVDYVICLQILAWRMVSGSCRPVLALEKLLSHHGGIDSARSVGRLRHHGVEKIWPGLGGQVSAEVSFPSDIYIQ